MGLPYLALPTAKGRKKKDATNPVRKVERDRVAEPVAAGKVGGAHPCRSPGGTVQRAPACTPKIPILPIIAPKNAAAAMWVFAVLEVFEQCMLGRFWGAMAPGLKPRRRPPSATPHPYL